jgi:uncharacterized protein involved in tolerance to divalent cations
MFRGCVLVCDFADFGEEVYTVCVGIQRKVASAYVWNG